MSEGGCVRTAIADKESDVGDRAVEPPQDDVALVWGFGNTHGLGATGVDRPLGEVESDRVAPSHGLL